MGRAVVFAILMPLAARAYLVGPPEGLDKMASNADLVCKARVVSFTVETNAAFQPLPGFETRASKLKIMKGLNQRAATFRRKHDNRFAGYDITQYYDRVDAQYTNSGIMSHP